MRDPVAAKRTPPHGVRHLRRFGMLGLCAAIAGLIACSDAPEPATTAPAPAAAETAAAAPDGPVADRSTVPAAAEPSAPAASSDGLEASFMGYGKARFGMTVEQVKQALGDAFSGQRDQGAGCFFLIPGGKDALPYFTLMIEGGKFVRYDVGNDTLVAPGGGRRGMTSDELDALYRNALQDAPHKFVRGGQYRSIAASGVAPSTLVFETNAAGEVTEWHVGLSPQAGYVEACEKHA
jgi:hypothetical protein